jgi:uncharacterized membrane protein
MPPEPSLNDGGGHNPSPPKASLGSLARRYFLTGLVVAAPLLITIYLITSVINLIDGWVRPLFPPAWAAAALPGLGVLIVVASLILLGALAANVVGRTLVRWGEELISRVPVIRSVYRPLRQVFQTMMSPSGRSFREVVTFEYPRPGIWVIGFVTGSASPLLRDPAGQPSLVNVFLPTTPNLYAGFLLLVPRDDLRPVAMSVEEAIKYVASAGMAVQPERISSAAEARSNK